MHDRRIMRGSTYAAMVIPAGTNPDAMMGDKSKTIKRTFRKTGQTTKKTKNFYPNRNIPTPEPVPGRQHMDIQTSPYKEILTDKPQEREQGIATEFYLDRPPVPLFQPRMPAKENCKSTQIYEGDDELFDFNAEVEPMLNVLISKTLEQARMEVLEETELEIIKSQQKEYDELVNAELIIAQRYEATEKRHTQETARRGVQDKARKAQKKSAHQKLNARIISKNYMEGIREEAMRELSSMGVLVPRRDRNMEEQVLPWLLDRVVDFLKEDYAAI
jgi:di/tripeptidase